MNRKIIKQHDPMKCLEVTQGFGTFYVCVIKARDLLDICQPIRAEALESEIDNDPLDIGLNKTTGSQRGVGLNRPEQISRYIKTGVAAFPNSIIIGANIDVNGYLLTDGEQEWSYNGEEIRIQKNSLAAAIIDGQHRLQGYELLQENEPYHNSLDDELVCSIYLNLPITYHAQLFSTINSTQRKVHKNLIYQLYQIDMDEKKPNYWSPEVLSVYLSRALGVDKSSPLHEKIVLAVNADREVIKEQVWRVSLSSVVESVLKLFSTNPVQDRDTFYSKRMEVKERKDLENDKSPFRMKYIEGKDRYIYESILDYLKIIFSNLPEESAYKSSIGISAMLDGLGKLLIIYSGDYDSLKQVLIKTIADIKFIEVPLDKTTKAKSLLRDIILFSIKKHVDDNIGNQIKVIKENDELEKYF